MVFIGRPAEKIGPRHIDQTGLKGIFCKAGETMSPVVHAEGIYS